MRTLYFDCFSGISGDMFLASLLDLGADEERVRSGLDKVGLTGYQLTVDKVVKGGIAATSVTVTVTDKTHPERKLARIEQMIDGSGLSDGVKQKSKAIFRRLAETEARIHNTTPERIHFHEVGATDSIVDILGSLIAVETLHVDEVYSSPIHVGTGEVRCQHGTLPVPAPATAELLRGIPVFSRGICAELTTPTGAALITAVATQFGPMPSMVIEAIGYGSGKEDLPERPNVLRAIIGEKDAVTAETDVVAVLETTIDDMSPEHYPWLVERLFRAGARDVHLVPVICKRGRPGTSVVTICDTNAVDIMAQIIFEETSSFGIRYRIDSRVKLSRELRQVETRWGKVHVKIGTRAGRTVSVSPEFKDCQAIAEREGVSLRLVYDEARAVAREMLKREGL